MFESFLSLSLYLASDVIYNSLRSVTHPNPEKRESRDFRREFDGKKVANLSFEMFEKAKERFLLKA